MRLQKYIAKSGVSSRRKAEILINQGRVRLNGSLVKEQGIKVTPKDIVEVDGKEIRLEEDKLYIILNKPVGYVSTVSDEHDRKTVLDLLPDVKKRIYPVGRLDMDTSGLLLLSNDGEFTNRVTHPSYEITKTYRALVDGEIDKKSLEKLEDGIMLDSRKTYPARVELIESKNGFSRVKISIHEGRNRQVRRMFDAVGYPVVELERISLANLDLKDLAVGEYRHLTKDEIKSLK